MIVLLVWLEKERSGAAFQVLEGGLTGGKIRKSFSVTQQTVVALLQTTLAQFYSG